MCPTASFVGRAAARGTDVRAPQDGAHARHQFTWVEGLAEVIVGAELQADDAVHVVAAGGEHQDRSLVRGAEFAQDVEAADVRQHDVQDQDFEIADLERGQSVGAVMHARHLEMLGFQIFREHLAQLAIVVDEQHAALAGRRRFCS